MKGYPLKLRIARKALDLAAWLSGNRRDVRSDAGPDAVSYDGPEAIAALTEIACVNACIMRKSLDKARVPLKIGRLDRQGQFTALKPSSSEDDPQNLLASINPNEGPASFFARSFAMQAATGDLFWQVEYLKRAKPRELWLLGSDRVKIVKGDNRKPLRYEYQQPNDAILRLEPEQVFHSRLPHPANDWRGLSPYHAVRRWAWLEDQIARHQGNMIQNGGAPPGFISFKEYVPVEEREDVRAQIRKRYGGPQNAHNLGVLWGDSSFVPTGLSNKDGDFLELDDRAVRKVAASFGVPLILLMDLSDASYANAVQQKGMYWQNTLIPELEIFAQDFTELVLKRLYKQPDLVARYDFEGIEAIQDLRLVRAESLTKLVAGGLLTQNEARAEMGKAPASGGDQLLAPQLLTPTGSVSAQPIRSGGTVRKKWIDTPERHVKRAEVGAALDTLEAETLQDVLALNERQKARALRKIALKAATPRTKDEGDDFTVDDFFDVQIEIDQTNALLVRVYSRIGSNRGQSAIDELGDDTRFNIGRPKAQEWIAREGGRQSVLIAGTLKDTLAQTLAAADAEGLTITEIAQRIGERFDLRADFESLRIARTETARAYNFATKEGWVQSEVVAGKEWLSAKDEAVRSLDKGDQYDHAAMDGVVVPLEEDFEVPGENGPDALDHPSDSKGQPGNTIDCRCAMKPVIDGEAKARKAHRKVVAPDVPLETIFAAA